MFDPRLTLFIGTLLLDMFSSHRFNTPLSNLCVIDIHTLSLAFTPFTKPHTCFWCKLLHCFIDSMHGNILPVQSRKNRRNHLNTPVENNQGNDRTDTSKLSWKTSCARETRWFKPTKSTEWSRILILHGLIISNQLNSLWELKLPWYYIALSCLPWFLRNSFTQQGWLHPRSWRSWLPCVVPHSFEFVSKWYNSGIRSYDSLIFNLPLNLRSPRDCLLSCRLPSCRLPSSVRACGTCVR